MTAARRRFGSIKRIRHGECEYLVVSYRIPADAFASWSSSKR